MDVSKTSVKYLPFFIGNSPPYGILFYCEYQSDELSFLSFTDIIIHQILCIVKNKQPTILEGNVYNYRKRNLLFYFLIQLIKLLRAEKFAKRHIQTIAQFLHQIH